MIFDANLKKVHISVAELCRTVVNYSSIDMRGARIYADSSKASEYFESKFGLSYTPDVSISRTFSRGGLFYDISGVCDGVIRRDGKITVCVNRTVNDFTSKITADMASEAIGNAVVLAYMIADSEMLTNVSFNVCFYHNQRDIKNIEKSYTKQELSAVFNRIIDMHRPFVALEAERVCVRIPEAKTAAFPFREIRPQQRDFMVEVLRAVKQRGKAVVEAPTGTGKTMAALFPAIKAFGNGYVDKIF